MWIEEVFGQVAPGEKPAAYFSYRGKDFPLPDGYEFHPALLSAVEESGDFGGVPVFQFRDDLEPFPNRDEFLAQLERYLEQVPEGDRNPGEDEWDHLCRILTGKIKFGDTSVDLLDREFGGDPYWERRKRQIRQEQRWLNERWAEIKREQREFYGESEPESQTVQMDILDLRAEVKRSGANGTESTMTEERVIDCHLGVQVLGTRSGWAQVQIVMIHEGNVVRATPPTWVELNKVFTIDDIIVKQRVIMEA